MSRWRRGGWSGVGSPRPIASIWPVGYPALTGWARWRSRWRAAPAGGTWRRRCALPGLSRIWPSRPTPLCCGGAKRRAKTDKADAQLLRELLATGRVPECYIPPSQVLEWRAQLELYHDLRVAHTGWVQRIHATGFHQGATALREAGVVRGSRERLDHIVADQLSPTGRLQVNTALSVMDTLAEHLDRLRRRLVATARH